MSCTDLDKDSKRLASVEAILNWCPELMNKAKKRITQDHDYFILRLDRVNQVCIWLQNTIDKGFLFWRHGIADLEMLY